MKVLFEREDLVIIEQEKRLVFVNTFVNMPLAKWYIKFHKGRLEEFYSNKYISDKTFEEAMQCIKQYYNENLINE